MLDMMTGLLKKSSESYPNSGPGNKTLMRGNIEYGYFGTVTAEQMSVYEGLSDILNNYSSSYGLSWSKSLSWLKIFYKEKVLFVPMGVCGAISYRDLEDARATYPATRDLKPAKLPISGKPMYSDNVVVPAGESSAMHVRLSTSSESATVTPAPTNIQNLAGSEFYDVWLGLSASVPTVSNPLGLPKFDLTGNRIEEFSLSEVTTSAGSSVVAFDGRSNTAATRKLDPLKEYVWRPILELVPEEERGNILSNLTGFTLESDFYQTPPIVKIDSQRPIPVSSVVASPSAQSPSISLTYAGLFNAATNEPAGSPLNDYNSVTKIVSKPPIPVTTSGHLVSDYFSINKG